MIGGGETLITKVLIIGSKHNTQKEKLKSGHERKNIISFRKM